MKFLTLTTALLITNQVSAGGWKSSVPSWSSSTEPRIVERAQETYVEEKIIAPRPQINIEPPRIQEVPQFNMDSFQSELSQEVNSLRNNLIRANDMEARQQQLQTQILVQNRIRDIQDQAAAEAQRLQDERDANIAARENDLRNQVRFLFVKVAISFYSFYSYIHILYILQNI